MSEVVLTRDRAEEFVNLVTRYADDFWYSPAAVERAIEAAMMNRTTEAIVHCVKRELEEGRLSSAIDDPHDAIGRW